MLDQEKLRASFAGEVPAAAAGLPGVTPDDP